MNTLNSGIKPNKITVYCTGGVATTRQFLQHFVHTLAHALMMRGFEVHKELLLPYGDASRNLMIQVHEVQRDMARRYIGRKNTMVGGQMVLNHIEKTYEDGLILLVGHSGGGIACLRAAKEMMESGNYPDPYVIQIGSPKSMVPERLIDRVLYLYGVNLEGRRIDQITRFGTWGGWERSQRNVPVWNAKKYAPKHVQPVTIIGGHPDYFRHQYPFILPTGETNLECTLKHIMNWLDRQFHAIHSLHNEDYKNMHKGHANTDPSRKGVSVQVRSKYDQAKSVTNQAASEAKQGLKQTQEQINDTFAAGGNDVTFWRDGKDIADKSDQTNLGGSHG